ncbi:HflK protein [Terasakiispira papahanaumokuakeensis]|uniref:Protein HflK n=1 Tax=Terasakiispira papahanaumokuakeensis TaxID=197479 RepID=A0A1E2V6Z5_9GAMM|nr:FtsH protease activity modulator HflK [Terasakiispira papahanaumokuakeensis]ODC02425.1 HflK protein [Terasakiispira papahanaumokuakeensis]
MAWNEPGGNGNQHDPWSGGGRGGGRGPDKGPPDLDEALKKFQDKLGGLFGGSGGGGSSQRGGYGLVGIILALVFALWFVSGIYTVDQSEQAVVLRFGKYHETVGPGPHWNPALIDSVHKVNTTRIRSVSQKATMLTEDENIVQVSISVQYAVDDPKAFLLNVRNPESSLENALDSALRHEVGSSTMNSILTEGREVLATHITSRLGGYLKNYGVGLGLRAVNVENTQAPDQVQDAFDDVIRAREDREKTINQARGYENQVIPQAQGEAQRIREQAQGYKQSVIAAANGEAQRFTDLLAEYQKAPAVTRERLYIQSMQSVMTRSSKVMVNQDKGNNMLYLPLDRLQGGTRSGSSTSGSHSASSAQQTSLNPSQMDELANEVVQRLNRRQNNNGIRREGR